MSYSFSARGATKALASAAVAAELAKVVEGQPMHAADQAQAQAAADAFIGVLADDESQDVAVTMYGSVTGRDGAMTGAQVNVSAYLDKKQS